MAPPLPDLSAAPGPGDALIVVDVQRDFLPGGALAVARGDAVLAPLNRAARCFARRALPVAATRDWHPPDHVSFRPQGGPWPPHCVAGTPGAAFAEGLRLPETVLVVSKGAARAREAFSGFDGTPLEARLRAAGTRRVFVGGLATDYCVRRTVLDAVRLGFAAVLLADAVRPVEARPGDGAAALAEMRSAGALLLDAARLCAPEAA